LYNGATQMKPQLYSHLACNDKNT